MLLRFDGRTASLFVGVGGTLGPGEKVVAVPWTRVAMREPEEGEFRVDLDLTRAELEAAPSFERPGSS